MFDATASAKRSPNILQRGSVVGLLSFLLLIAFTMFALRSNGFTPTQKSPMEALLSGAGSKLGAAATGASAGNTAAASASAAAAAAAAGNTATAADGSGAAAGAFTPGMPNV